MIIPKEMIGRYCDVLVPGVSVMEIRIKDIKPDEIIGEYRDGEEVHINHPAIAAWWPDPKREKRVTRAQKAVRTKKEKEAITEEKEEEEEGDN